MIGADLTTYWQPDNVMAAAARLGIILPRDLAEMIRTKVRTGDYACKSEVICDALRLWQRHQEPTAEKRVW